MKFNMISFVLIIVGLFVGNIVGTMVLEAINISYLANPLVAAIAIGIITMIVLAVIGAVSGKMTLTLLLLGAVIIFIGGLVGTYLASYLELTGFIATFVVLVVQAILLLFFGITGKGKTKLAPKILR